MLFVTVSARWRCFLSKDTELENETPFTETFGCV